MKNWSAFLVCLLLSAGIWLIHTLSRTQTDIVTVSVLARSGITGRSEYSADEVAITARCHASGFRLFYLGSGSRSVVVDFAPEDFQHDEGDMYSISSNQLQRYISDIFGQGVTVESFFFDKVQFRFPAQANKKVPLIAVADISCQSQYMLASSVLLRPDSVLVYGNEDLLERVHFLETLPIERSGVRGNLSGETGLKVPEGIRVSTATVRWSIEVSRYVEIKTSMPVHVKNAHEGSALFVNPSYVDVSFKCIFPVAEDPSSKAYYYVDYDEFVSSRGGHCVVKCDSLPLGVISATLEPEVVACVEKSDFSEGETER